MDCLGEFLGNGKTRTVYIYAPDPQWVVKVSKYHNQPIDYGSGNNFKEQANYRFLCQVGLGRWVAECRFVDGLFLMRRLETFDKSKSRPATIEIPSCLKRDTKPANWGIVPGRPEQVVCCDFTKIGKVDGKMITVKWKSKRGLR